MKRKFYSYPITDYSLFKTQLLNFGKRFSNFCFLDNQEYNFDKSYECIAGFGIFKSLTSGNGNNFSSLNYFLKNKKDWVFGHISYDVKNEIENVTSKNKDYIGFPDFQFFIPELVFILSKKIVEIGIDTGVDSKKIFEEIINIVPSEKSFPKSKIKSRFSKNEYLKAVKKIQSHISRGDCYEICFCREYYHQGTKIDPVSVFKKLCDLSPNPFSALYKSGEKYLICASPERFLKKIKNVIISQPIKGTSKRNVNTFESEAEKSRLFNDEKERAENIMIVDLVRNDLSKICTEGSVYVKEFLNIYSFPQVHQMISTITGKLRKTISFTEILSATFPMGSMTGAPKKRAMELIEEYEKTKRGLFSGSVGYINPEGDFDFNVVIRSILYNEKNKYLSIQAGSAITWKSIPEKEFEEGNIKIDVIKRALERT